MQSIVTNRCRRGTLLSPKGMTEYVARKFGGTPPPEFSLETLDRTDPVLVQMMRENPGLYGGLCSHIKIITVADDFKWKLVSQGNFEWVAADVNA
jgi:hypothetical protein